MQETSLDARAIRSDFPIFDVKFKGRTLAYLDNAATSQKPKQVIESLSKFYQTYNSNIHRGVYRISEMATEAYEGTRQETADFVGAGDPCQLVFTRNATEAINLVSYAWGRANVKKGDKILLTMMEHHSNIVPWQQLAKQVGAQIDYVCLKDDFTLDGGDLDEKLPGTKLLAVTHVSNVLGTINPIKEITAKAHRQGALVLVDGAQSCPHLQVDVGDLGCDFFAFSSHKMLGPTGVGVLFGRKDLLEEMPPFLTGGDMIKQVTIQGASWNELPWKFEAGTSNVADVIAFSEAIRYLRKVGMPSIRQHEVELTKYALDLLGKTSGIEVYGPSDLRVRAGVVPFSVEGVHPHDVASILDSECVAVRSGNHCAQPLHDSMSLDATVRASMYLYNTEEDIDRLAAGLVKARQVLAR